MTDRATRWEMAGATLVALAVTALWAADAWVRHAMGIPRDDDWSYLRTAFDFADTGHLVLNGWVHMFFLGQAVWAAPVIAVTGENIAALQMATMLFGVAGLTACYAISRRFLSTGLASLAVLTLALGPIYGHFAPTFMTDVPVFALQALTVLVGLRALESSRLPHRWAWVGLATLLGVAAFTVREYGIVTLIAVYATTMIRFRKDRRFIIALAVLVAATLFVVACLYVWRSGLPNAIDTDPLPLRESARLFARAALLVAFLLIPLLAALSPLEVMRRSWQRTRVGSVAVVVGALVVLFVADAQFLGNVLHPYGSTWTTVGDGVRMVPLGWYRALVLMGAAALAYAGLAGLALLGPGERWPSLQVLGRRIAVLSWTVVLLITTYTVAMIVVGSPLFDRYFLIIIPFIGVLLLRRASRSDLLWTGLGRWVAPTILAVLTVLTFPFVDTASQVDGARWRAAERVAVTGIGAELIDGGDPWYRFHQNGAGGLENRIPGRTWWTTFFPGSRVCRMVALESETDLTGVFGRPLEQGEENTILGLPFRVMVFRGPDEC